ncbi:hypothetical protein M413DRAFT_29939 [Hebeloma cylindrosporum]|uniref:Uncharacterized protein n=1 Tax=Hebeloma cylindrosporum TaxID=76867 RepID=A0A0C2YCI3_HEBCY|nr:hypothetical protein M413DRAFT_29939 [Hebeloma cylindrosporum h7]
MARLVSEIAWVASKPPPSAELQERYQRFGFANLRVSSKIPENWYCLLRNVQGAAALPAIQSGKLKHMLRESSHGAWAYYIDFESRMLETWGGEDTRLDRVTFENMIMDGADEYVARVNRNLAKVTEDDEEEEEEQEEDSEEEEGEEGEGGEEN